MFKWLTVMSNTNRPFFSKRHLEGDKYLSMLSIYIPFRKISEQKGILFSKITDERIKIELF